MCDLRGGVHPPVLGWHDLLWIEVRSGSTCDIPNIVRWKSYVMLVKIVRRVRHGLESVEDQVFADVGCVVQVSKSDLMASGVALNLLQMAKRVGP